jgi:dephospho-CoA kinase
MKIVGLTGGIGSGKSTLMQWFQKQGVPCFESDAVGRKLLNTDLREAVSEAFGAELYLQTGSLDRKALAEKVFANPAALAKLNQIVHPAVAIAFEDFKKQHANAPFVINEAAILFETGGYKNCDVVILVTTPKSDRIERIINRDGSTKAEVIKRMKNQWEDERKRKLADYVIENSTIKSAQKQAAQILEKLDDAL